MNIREPVETSTLSISSPSIPDCSEVAEYFKQCKIRCHVVPNWTVECTDKTTDTYAIESGCQIKIGNHSPYLINALFFDKLKERFDLQCAYLKVDGKYQGCIYDYFEKSKCPSSV